jgi:hypothetical protein
LSRDNSAKFSSALNGAVIDIEIEGSGGKSCYGYP